jgi:serine/threonine protein kinase/tetratricopeptide (TPR) repeat protein
MKPFTKVSKPLPLTSLQQQSDLDEFVAAFEAAASQGQADLRTFLPERDHPLYLEVLAELVRVDLELTWGQGRGRRLEDYAREFPQLFTNRTAVGQLAFEEFRLRSEAGERPDAQEYQRRWGVRTADWLRQAGPHKEPPAENASDSSWRKDLLASVRGTSESDGLQQTAIIYQAFCRSHERQESQALEFGSDSGVDSGEHAQLFRDLHALDPEAAGRLAEAVTSFPEVGTTFLGFSLLQELGKGAFGRVYLAQQGDLANRLVAVKVAADIFAESQTLAQLQHTNIVPIYSVHRASPFQAVCMPYFGATTLADVLQQVSQAKTLPLSGKVLVSTLNDRKASTRRRPDSSSTSRSPASAWPPVPGELPEAGPVVSLRGNDGDITLKMLESLTYVDAVLWIAARLADGLSHAHERGILHRDLKPANILLTEDGQPMLLDFNLSSDRKARGGAAAASIGGTLPYMAPEHLEAFCGKRSTVDERSDLFSLGVILYELLAGKTPFASAGGVSRSVLKKMIADRHKPFESLRRQNPAVSPAVESIVQRCLEPDPARRYQSARELHEDVERHRKHLPLKFAPEPSLRERAQKWVRRHPRLTSYTTVGVAAGLLITALATGFVVRGHQVARQEAREGLEAFQDQVRTAQALLYARSSEPEDLEEGARICQSALGQYQILDNPSWQKLPAVTYLREADREQLKEDAAELLFLLAHATSKRAETHANSAKGKQEIQQALVYNGLAEERTESVSGKQALWRQRTELARTLGDPALAQQAKEKATATPVQTVRDLYLTAHEYAQDGEYRRALPLLQEATRRDPQNFPAWAVQGNCHDALAQDVDAAACYSACIALRPKHYLPWFNRGLSFLKQRFWERARADFDEAIALRPELPDAYINRALALEGMNQFTAAAADLSEALKRGTPRTRVYFMRAYAREQAGDREGARRDTEEGLRQVPGDEKSWIARGLARLAADPQGALADFDQALELNPRSIDALQNKAHVLAEKLGRENDAIGVLGQAVSLNVDFVPARAGRGVYLARAGKYAAAREDASEALLRDTRPPNLYQVAGIYAQTSRQNPADRLKAFELLSSALRSGFGLDIVDQDSDLEPIRKFPEFERLVKAARALQVSIRQGGK